MLGVHRAHETQVVHDGCGVRQRVGNVHPRLPVLVEFERRRQQKILIARLVDLDAIGMRLTGAPRQFGLGIEQIHLARTAVLNELNDRLGFGGKVRAPGGQIAVNLNFRGGLSVSLQKVRQNNTAETEAASLQQPAARKGIHMLAIMIVYTGIVNKMRIHSRSRRILADKAVATWSRLV